MLGQFDDKLHKQELFEERGRKCALVEWRPVNHVEDGGIPSMRFHQVGPQRQEPTNQVHLMEVPWT
jgi:hypothetical protein